VQLPVSRVGPRDFATFFADEHPGLLKLLYFVTGSRADADELMKDAFLKLWERWDQVDRIADPRAYLFRVALNGFRMRTRAARRAARRLVPMASSFDPFDGDEVHHTDRADVGLRLDPAVSSSCLRQCGRWEASPQRRHPGQATT
jgi:DNA-directed RNA polymerase specialized sigma24 family protein